MPQRMLLLVTLVLPMMGAQAQVTQQDSLALVALYNATDGPNWTENTNWLTGPVSTWSGVTVEGGRVTRLFLFGYGLTGPIPPEIGDLTGLTELILELNRLSGEIPPEIGDLTELTDLNVFENLLSGPIPPEIGDLTGLTDLILGLNGLSGPIPPELGNLSNLEVLSICDTGLSGAIPPEIGDLASLRFLDFRANGLSGEIPPEIGDLASLEVLLLSANGLSGEIPPEIGDLASLRDLELSINQLSGSIPPELGDLTGLTFLGLRSNQLSGSVPLAVARLGAAIESMGGTCRFANNDPSLCVPDTPPYQAIGQDPICGLFLSASCVPGPVTRYVSTTGSDTANDCTDLFNPCATLGHATNQADAGDIINLAAGTYLEPGLVLDKELILQGEGVIVR